MNITKWNIRIKNIFLGILATMMMFSFTSPVIKVSFATSVVVPAARGYVKVKKGENMNYNIQIQIRNLSEVTGLQPAKRTYVVWLISDHFITENLGQLDNSTSALHNKFKTSFETESLLKPSKIFITAEDEPDVPRPGVQVVLATNIF
jgi:hypothetical protein